MSILCMKTLSARHGDYSSDLKSAIGPQIYSTLPPPVVSLRGSRKGTNQRQFSRICRHRHVLLSSSIIHVCPHSLVKGPQCYSKPEHYALQSRSMEETYDLLARRLLDTVEAVGSSTKYLIGLAGPPGAGKSTVAQQVVARVNHIWNAERACSKEIEEIAVAVPMDGFHLYRWQLDKMEDPAEAHARRGAPWTFDPVGLANRLMTLREKGSVSLPSFDHGVGDPVEDDIHVEERHKVILVEGNYLLLSEGNWSAVGNLFDERWQMFWNSNSTPFLWVRFGLEVLGRLQSILKEMENPESAGGCTESRTRFIEVDIDEAMRRVERRHVVTGKPPDVAKWRVAYNDRPNAELIQQSKCNADLLIPSLPLKVSESV